MIQQSAFEDVQNDVTMDVFTCMELLDSATNITGMVEDETWLYVVEAAYILCETIKRYANGIEEWQIWRFVLESECTPVTMENYARDVLKRVESERLFKKYIEGE